MNKLVSVFCLLSLTVFSQNNFKKKASVLFLGNSYTYVNDLPMLIYNVTLANGDTMAYDANTIGGYTFKNHFNDAVSIAKIKSRAWDYVILQAQSQEPSFPDQQVISETLPYAMKLDSVVRDNSNCSSVVFYETWGRKNGDQSNCQFFPPLCTYLGMQNRLRKWYKKFADTTLRIMAPVGEAFRSSIAASPTLELYSPDQSHPSLEGSYLAACVFYETLFQKSVLSNTYNPGLSVNTLTFLQQTAHNIVHDSLPVWNLGKNLPWAGFTHSLTGNDFQFTTVSNGLTNTWYFGDGSTSTVASPTHSYLTSGTFTVSHVVTLGCKKDSVVKVITYTNPSVGVHPITGNQRLNMYPNPCQTSLYLSDVDKFKKEGVIEITDLSGRVVIKTPFVNPIPVSQLSNGTYFIKIADKINSAHARFIKNE